MKDGNPIPPDDPITGKCDPDTSVQTDQLGNQYILRSACITWTCNADDTCTSGGQCTPNLKDCSDDDPCTVDACVDTTGECLNEPDPACCTYDTDPPLMDEDPNWDEDESRCWDDDPCTSETCDYESGVCSYEPVVCYDGNACTLDSCSGDGCVFAPMAGCEYDCYNDYDCRDDHGKLSGELCDDGNNVSGDGCSADCQSLEICGNGYLDWQVGEECDDGNGDDEDSCTTECKRNISETCGDGETVPGEACDDGNNEDDDGCAANCSSDETCGNTVIDWLQGEKCDDGNNDDGDQCSADCKTISVEAGCGDSDVDAWDTEGLCNLEDCQFQISPFGKCSYEDLSCDDGRDCTDAYCDDFKGCIFFPTDCSETSCEEPLPNTLPIECDDGFICTIDACVDGLCQVLPIDCDDEDPCTIDYCNPETGSCVHVNDDECQTSCTEMGAVMCDIGSECYHAVCLEDIDSCFFAPIICDDRDICTTDTCDPDIGCTFESIEDCAGCVTADDCNDGLECTQDECVSANEAGAADVDYQANGFEHPDRYCTYTNTCFLCEDDSSCEIQFGDNPCVTAFSCNLVTLMCELEYVSCDDDDICTADSCDTETGLCVNTPVVNCCTDDTMCKDTKPCTGGYCDTAASKCVFPFYLCDDRDPCTTDTCHPGTGDCEHEQVDDCFDECGKPSDCYFQEDLAGQNCASFDCGIPEDGEDGDPKTCIFNATECISDHECQLAGCEQAIGACIAAAEIDCDVSCVSFEDCDDGNACTVDQCSLEGLCVTKEVDCSDGDLCTSDACDRATGACTNTECEGCLCESCSDDTPCDDNNVCTLDNCIEPPDEESFCKHEIVDCSDGDPCSIDSCDAETGCTHTNLEKCVGCVKNSDCDDLNACTVDVCEDDKVCSHLFACGEEE